MDNDHIDQTLFGGDLPETPSERDHTHSLVIQKGPSGSRYFEVDQAPLVIGRNATVDIPLADRRVSSRHCRVWLEGQEIFVEDLGSTNGTWIDGKKVSGMARLAIGGFLLVGETLLRHEYRSREDLQTSVELDGDLRSAARYVEALLPAPRRHRSPLVEWSWRPCATLGGDAFGYGELEDGSFAAYLIDVCGHGAGSALHSVSVINTLRRRTLVADFTSPSSVLDALNRAFPMESHGGMYFTMWYSVYRPQEKLLHYATAGHPPALLVTSEDTLELRTRNMPIGMMDPMDFDEDEIEIEPKPKLFVCSDGCFEVHTSAEDLLGFGEFRSIVLQSQGSGEEVPRQIFESVKTRSRNDVFEDDFSLLVLDFQ